MTLTDAELDTVIIRGNMEARERGAFPAYCLNADWAFFCPKCLAMFLNRHSFRLHIERGLDILPCKRRERPTSPPQRTVGKFPAERYVWARASR